MGNTILYCSFFAIFHIVLLSKSSLTSASALCSAPPQFWCDNSQIASECGVTEQCKKFYNSNAKSVNFTLYYESMCPDCKDFYKNQLAFAFENVGSIMNLMLVPYGNAQTHYDGSSAFKYRFECQHGVEECTGNMIETCAIDIYKDIHTYFPFINCIENSDSLPRKSAVGCADQHKLNITKIMTCVNSYHGHFLENQMGLKTQSLRPRHQYVPWVTLNGVHTDKIQDMAQKDLISLICTTYTGSPKPKRCEH